MLNKIIQPPLNQEAPKSVFPWQKQMYVVRNVFSMRNKTDRKIPTLLQTKLSKPEEHPCMPVDI